MGRKLLSNCRAQAGLFSEGGLLFLPRKELPRCRKLPQHKALPRWYKLGGTASAETPPPTTVDFVVEPPPEGKQGSYALAPAEPKGPPPGVREPDTPERELDDQDLREREMPSLLW